MANRYPVLGKGGVWEEPPHRLLPGANGANGNGAANGNGSTQKKQFYDRKFEFLSLGLMAYIGNDKALTQVELDDTK